MNENLSHQLFGCSELLFGWEGQKKMVDFFFLPVFKVPHHRQGKALCLHLNYEELTSSDIFVEFQSLTNINPTNAKIILSLVGTYCFLSIIQSW